MPISPTLPTARYRKVIAACADLVALPFWSYRGERFGPETWLEGLILHESVGDPRATRYEAHQDTPDRQARDADPDRPGLDDGILEDDKSYGLMQVMGTNARRLVGAPPGTRMDFGWLLLPLANIAMGLRILAGELAATGGNVERALARYNGGPTGESLVSVNGALQMRRQPYVDLVHAATRRVAEDRG